ncbi:MAG: SDR family NAD(P)-dependent oxidoreductase [Acidimicrobiales bacterium]|nr:SDR family NAD(P)-dependent oxidoreductase [Acidimicrobiales bacterium]
MNFTNRTIVVTGGASGIGKSIARKFGLSGFKVCIGDIEEQPLVDTLRTFRDEGIEAYGQLTDVSDETSMNEFSDYISSEVGPPGVVCLNAGVGAGGPMGQVNLKDWEWVLAVNLWGVIHGINLFLPTLEKQNEGHIVVTASVAGHLSYPGMGPYNASKHAVLTMAETLYLELKQANSNIEVSALCPGLVRTQILDSGRNKHEKFQNIALEQSEHENIASQELIQEMYANALDPRDVAEMVFEAVKTKRFYVFTDEVHAEHIKLRHRLIEGSHNPTMDGNLIDHAFDNGQIPEKLKTSDKKK